MKKISIIEFYKELSRILEEFTLNRSYTSNYNALKKKYYSEIEELKEIAEYSNLDVQISDHILDNISIYADEHSYDEYVDYSDSSYDDDNNESDDYSSYTSY